MTIAKLISSFAQTPSKLFLIDGIGAVVSAFFLGVVLVRLESLIGMPPKLLLPLSYAAYLFAVYSFTCYFKTPNNWRPFLRTIAIVNLLYCCVTIGLVVQQYHNLTGLGLTYFILEKAIIIPLAFIELKTANKDLLKEA